MPTNFDQPIDRTGTHSVKWDYRQKIFGNEDVLPMWVADMDFPAAPAVSKVLEERAAHPIFGYSVPSEELFNSVINWYQKRHNWPIQKEWLAYVPGVMPGINYAIQEFTKPGDEIVIQPPVYPPFDKSIKNNNRLVINNPLTLEDGLYKMDFDDLTAKISKDTKMLLLCNPHNPVGRVWTRKELEQLGRICVENNILVISDEIHDDIIYSGNQHYPIAHLSEQLAQITITLSSPGKTFNLQGMQMGYAIIPDQAIKKRFRDRLERNWVHLYNPLTIEATTAAYEEGEEWLDDLLTYLEQNRDYLVDYVQKNIPGIDVIVPDGTYICWLDCRALELPQEKLRNLMTNNAKVGLNDGLSFGKGGEGFQRLNFACPGSTLEEGLKRIDEAVNGNR